MQVEVRYNPNPTCEDDDDEIYFIFTTETGIEINLNFEGGGVEHQDWLRFIERMNIREKAELDFGESNGGSSIEYCSDKNQVTFEMAKFGAGNGGSFSVTMPYDMCRSAFEQIKNYKK